MHESLKQNTKYNILSNINVGVNLHHIILAVNYILVVYWMYLHTNHDTKSLPAGDMWIQSLSINS